jgi:hypothetical protein
VLETGPVAADGDRAVSPVRSRILERLRRFG